jgi:hypothetical protein
LYCVLYGKINDKGEELFPREESLQGRETRPKDAGIERTPEAVL